MRRFIMASSKCYIESLPVELLSPILTYLPDLESLDNVLRASPAAFRVFDNADFSATIFETVLSPGTTHKYSCALIRIITLIRADLLPLYPSKVYDSNTFKNLIVHETTPSRYKPPLWEHTPVCLPLHIDPSILRGILATNRKILRLTFGCLDFYLGLFRVLRPYHSAGFRYDGKPWILDDGMGYSLGTWGQKPVNVKFYYPTHDIGPPTWLEQQRVYRILWRIQLSHDIKAIVRASRITWPKYDEFNWKLDSLEPKDLSEVPYGSSRDEMLRDSGEWRETTLEEELIDSITQYIRESPERISEAKYLVLRRESANVPAPASLDDRFVPGDRFVLDHSDFSEMCTYSSKPIVVSKV